MTEVIRDDMTAPAVHTKADVSYILLITASALFAFNYFLYNTELFDAGRTPIRLAALVLLATAFFLRVRELKIYPVELLFVVFSMVMLLIHGIEAGNYLFIVVFGILARSYDTGRLLRDLAIIGVAVIAVNLICIAAGLLSNVSYVSTEGRARNTFGYVTPNHFSLTLLILPALYLVPSWNKRIVIVSGTILCLAAMMYTDTRSVIGAVAALIFFQLVFSALRKAGRMRLAGEISIMVLIGCVVVSILIPSLADSSLDVFLSYRPSIFQRAFGEMSILDYVVGINHDNTIDNFYLYTIMSFGIFSLVFAGALIVRAIKVHARKGDDKALAFICAMLLLGAIESSIFRPELIPVLFFWALVFDTERPGTINGSGEKCGAPERLTKLANRPMGVRHRW